MSSHHFVREGQEPALLIAENVSYKSVEQLLEWSPFVLVSEVVLEKILSWGIRVDAVITIPDHADRIRKQLREYQEVELIIASTREDVIVRGIDFILAKGQYDVNIFVDSLEKFSLGFAERLQRIRPVVFEGDWRWIPVSNIFQKWVSAGTRFKFLDEKAVKSVSTHGVREDGGVYVASGDGIISFSGPELMWIGEFYENK